MSKKDVEQTENLEATEVQSNEPVEEIVETPEVEASGEEGTEPETPAYQPNYKFKVLNEEKEFDEFIRAAIKDADTEKKARELYEKAYGIDHVKAQRDEERTAKTRVENEYHQLMDEIAELGEIRKKDYGLFFKKLGIPKQEIAAWIYREAQALDATEKLPENLKSVYTDIEELRHQNYLLQKKMEAADSGRQSAVLQARRTDLTNVLVAPETKTLVDQYDARLGKPGSFEQMVIRHAAAEWEASQGKRDLSAREAVNEVIQMLGLTPTPPGQASGSTQSPKVVAPPKAAVLPNVGSGTATPTVAKKPQSIADLREMAKAMQG